MPDNKITNILAQHTITIARLREETQLGNRTCYKVVKDPTAHFRPETAKIFQEWVRENIGEYSLEDLFDPDNLKDRGALPQVTPGQKIARKGMVICRECYTETRIAETCSNCGENLPAQTT